MNYLARKLSDSSIEVLVWDKLPDTLPSDLVVLTESNYKLILNSLYSNLCTIDENTIQRFSLNFSEQKTVQKLWEEIMNKKVSQSFFESTVPGNGALIRDCTNNIIRIGFRHHNKCYKNITPISDSTKAEFFKDVKKTKVHKVDSKKWLIADITDPELYKKWGAFMDETFYSGIKNKN